MGNNTKIAVASQNRRTITGHTGRCRIFRLFEIAGQDIIDTGLVELEEDETFHASGHKLPTGLAGITAIISAGMGPGLIKRLQEEGIEGIICSESDPQFAIKKFRDGTLEREEHTAHPHTIQLNGLSSTD